jgi:UDP-3-O-[3-hydroxymyristoyl] glucosamine N-acyltransferase
MSIKLSELADFTGTRLHGDDCLIDNVADLTVATPGQLGFVYNPKYLGDITSSSASAVVIKEDWLDSCDKPALVSEDPRRDFARIAALLNPVQIVNTGVAETAVIAEDVDLPEKVSIGANAVIDPGVEIGQNVQVGAGVSIAKDVKIGDNTVIYANVSIGSGVQIGSDCTVFSGAVIGTDGFGYVKDGESYLKVPQIGGVVIGDNVDIGANATIDRGSLLDTVIHDGVKLDNQVHVAHNVVIGKHTVISAYTGISGSVTIGENCIIGGGVGIRDNIEITDNVIITGRTFVSSKITEPGSYSSSILLDDTRNWRKNVTRFKHLDDMFKRVKNLEKKLEKKLED